MTALDTRKVTPRCLGTSVFPFRARPRFGQYTHMPQLMVSVGMKVVPHEGTNLQSEGPLGAGRMTPKTKAPAVLLYQSWCGWVGK